MSDGLSTESHDECLDINEPYIYDESIQSLQYFEFTPQTFANCNIVGHPMKDLHKRARCVCSSVQELHQYQRTIAT